VSFDRRIVPQDPPVALFEASMARSKTSPSLGWFGIARLGLVQMSLGAVVVMMTSTINRVMVVELALAAMIPGLLVALHYAIQVLRPRWGYGSDVGGRRTPWIVGGMAALCLGGVGAAVATAVMAASFWAGLALAVLAFTLLGIGVGAAGTSVLALMAVRVAPERRAAAATIVWVMMIFGLAMTATVAGKFLDPFSTTRLIVVMATVAVLAFVLACVAVWGLEASGVDATARTDAPKPAFLTALREVWTEPEARRFTVFVFVSMLAYNAQELILEPFAGLVFGMTAGQSTALAGVQHGGVLAGMILVSVGASVIGGRVLGSLKLWTVGGCLASAAALVVIAAGGLVGPQFPIRAAVFALGVANGSFAVAAIGAMMSLASAGTSPREGTRLGLWGAAQAIAFGVGGLLGALAVDIMRRFVSSPVEAYGLVFVAEAALFVVGAWLALGIGAKPSPSRAGTAVGGRLATGSHAG
jgi:BCD family chlorophyll transporter-like MFS transporter